MTNWREYWEEAPWEQEASLLVGEGHCRRCSSTTRGWGLTRYHNDRSETAERTPRKMGLRGESKEFLEEVDERLPDHFGVGQAETVRN